MSWQSILQFALLLVSLAVTAPLVGRYIAAVYGAREDGSAPGDRVFRPVERFVYRLLGVDEQRSQRWNVYALSLVAFSLVSLLVLYLLQRLQGVLPFNPTGRAGVAPTGAFNTAVSFVTNTNWQWYAGEVTMSHLTQMLGLAVQNFVSAGVGICVAVALIRGIAGSGSRRLGNFWVDLTRSITRILLPASFVFALVLVSQGVVQNLHGYTSVTPLDPTTQVVEQQIPGGPVASQEAIKQLGTNGGGFYNANSSHPFENPNTVTDFLQIYALLIIPFGLAFAFGHLVRDRRQSRVVVGVMVALWMSFAALAMFAEQNGNPALASSGADQSIATTQSGGNMEGKEVRFGPATCGLYAASTTGTSTGAVNCMHDSTTPLGGMSPMAHMMLGEVSPGGIGVGMMGFLVYALLAVFIAGLMVGRTPEYLGKKIQAPEMKLVVLFIAAMPIVVLLFAGISVVLSSADTFQSGPHGLSEVLYNFASVGNNNGSAFASMGTGTDWYTMTMGLAMLVGRFFLIIPALAIGGSLAAKPRIPATSGTFPTHTAQFGGLVLGVILIVTGLEFFPALALGPIVEHLSL